MRGMKLKILAISLTIGFIGLAVFGFLFMHVASNSYVGPCVAALGGNTEVCPHNNLASAYFHIDAFRSFSNILPAAVAFLILIIAALLIFNFSLATERREASLSAFGILARNITSLFALAVPLGRWLTLREREAAASVF